MQTLDGRIVSGDQAHGQSCFDVSRYVQHGVDNGGALANQIHITMQSKAHHRIGFQRLRPGRLDFKLGQINISKEFQNGLDACVVTGALWQGFNAGHKMRVLLHHSLWFAFGVHAEHVFECVPK